MPELDPRDRARLSRRDFAYVDRDAGEHLPLNDAGHVRNAMARWNQTDFESRAARERARERILAAASKYGIEVAEDDRVARPVR